MPYFCFTYKNIVVDNEGKIMVVERITVVISGNSIFEAFSLELTRYKNLSIHNIG